MSWVRIWVHIVFTTKNKVPYLHTFEIRQAVFQHNKEEAYRKNIMVDCVNGYRDHTHCLISLTAEQQLSKVVQSIKGESSYWINSTGLISKKFAWQDDYWAVSVSESHLASVRQYIHRQEEHHRKQSFSEEIDQFMKKYGWKLMSS